MAKDADGLVGRIVALQSPAVAADPDLAGTVAQQCAHLVVRQAGAHRRIRPDPPHEVKVLGIDHVDAAECGDPQDVGARLQQGQYRWLDLVAGDAERIDRYLPQRGGGRVQHETAAPRGADHHAALFALDQRLHLLADQTAPAIARQHDALEDTADGPAHAESAQAADPDIAVPVYPQRDHVFVVGRRTLTVAPAQVFDLARRRVPVVQPVAGADVDAATGILGERTHRVAGQAARPGARAQPDCIAIERVEDGDTVGIGAHP